MATIEEMEKTMKFCDGIMNMIDEYSYVCESDDEIEFIGEYVSDPVEEIQEMIRRAIVQKQ